MVQWDDMKCYDLLFLGRFLFSFGFCLIFILVILLYDKACSFGGLAGTLLPRYIHIMALGGRWALIG